MRIAIDARWILPRISGIGAYTRELLRALARMDHGHRFTLFFDRADLRDRTVRETGIAGRPEFDLRLLPWGVFDPRSQLGLPRRLRAERVDLFHSPNFMIPLLAFPRHQPGPVRAVVTMHDLIPLQHPDQTPHARKTRFFPLYRALMHEIARRTDALITVSEASRADCLARFRLTPDQVHVVPNGVSSEFRPPPEGPAPRPRAAGADATRRILFVGRADPYKNLGGLLQAVARLRTSLPFPVRLVIAGPRDDRYPEAPDLARRLGLEPDVEWTGYLSDTDLLRRYQEADLLCLPSRCEGFGLPVVEAMACGTPVVISTAAALREVAGDAALAADPDDWDGLADRMRQILTQPETAARLAQAGLRRAAAFTWERAAAQTLAVYEKTAARSGKDSP